MQLGLNANIASDASKLRFWEPSLIPTYSELETERANAAFCYNEKRRETRQSSY